MKITFYKYQGAGNDFIIIDNRNECVQNNQKEILAIIFCDRKFGIGSDGIIFIENTLDAEFKMDFLNPDGSRSFCGNGSRCAVKFAHDLNIIKQTKTTFLASDGIHAANLLNDTTVTVQMNNVNEIKIIGDDYFAETGSPHYVSIFNSIDELDMIKFGHKIRYSEQFKIKGTNVNAIEVVSNLHLKVRTYERGVENETLACGTGVTACALSYALKNNISSGNVKIEAVGGDLKVSFNQYKNGSFNSIWLEGPAKFVFKGEIHV